MASGGEAKQKGVGSVNSIRASVLRIAPGNSTDDESHYELVCHDLNDDTQFCYYLDSASDQVLWEGANLCFVNNRIDIPDKSQFLTHPETLVVIEPDYLVDASAIAECFMDRTSNANLFFLQRCLPRPSTAPMISGILVNQLLDAYLSEESPDFQEVYKKTLVSNIFTALHIGSTELGNIRRMVMKDHLPMIERVTAMWKGMNKILEPTFISVDYGLQGRLDVLLEKDAEDSTTARDIIELKSSKARDRDVWTNHRMQVVCYHLLLRSVYGDERSGNNYILYSRALNNPLREVPTYTDWENMVVTLRNQIVGKIYEYAHEGSSILDYRIDSIGDFPPFLKDEIIKFQSLVRGLSEVEKHYVDCFVRFLFRELWHVKVGSTSHLFKKHHGFSALWQMGRQAKKDDFSLMDGLVLESLEKDVLIFRIQEDSDVSNFREGDIVILYPDSDEQDAILHDQLRKGFISKMTLGELTLQMKNTGGLEKLLAKHRDWIIEHDFMESGTFNMIRAMFNFMRGERSRRELILGIKEPAREMNHVTNDDETERIIDKAMKARDYFLLQGPPGTGKTSRILTSLVKRIETETNENMMILAFTNRAVDEICDKLEQNCIDYLRLGHGSSGNHHHLDRTIENMTFLEIRDTIESSRIFVSTVSTFLGQYQELLRIKKFDTLFVDEASQLLEPHLAGILIHFKRFILIGDQNQLPAIVTQTAEENFGDDEALKELEFHNFHQSLFERLYRQCVKREWTQAYDMLTNHYRMHKEIQELINPFYSNRLNATISRQFYAWESCKEDASLEEKLASSRVLFIGVPSRHEFKKSETEANVISGILDIIKAKYGNEFTSDTVGVITTWRAQVNEIRKHIFDGELVQKVTIDTVERYQGSERDIIIYSTALSSPEQLELIESLSADMKVDRKLNVAISRAREQFILIGDPDVLGHSEHYRRVMEQIKARNGYI
ncbi:MAG TPA: AAA domain-containing protein [Candidatus Cloacimonadota bacterium]|nr:AAA domain-containing protein [Candidatus Cloacimonadota bacterium]HPT72071.1 AAA domain-containing protein [Candidatus Cloacimonadota bacterium]